MNKKKLLINIFVGMFLVGLVSAIGYYALFSTTFTVLPAIVVENGEQSLGDVFSGETYEGETITITNDAPSKRTITLSDDSDEDIIVSYISDLTLSQKVVDFESDVWELTGDTANVQYTVIGNEFTAEVTDGAKEDFVLVYYKDNSDRFNSPATTIGIDSIVFEGSFYFVGFF